MDVVMERPAGEPVTFHSTPRLRVFLSACISGAGLYIWYWTMDRFNPDITALRFLGLFLVVSTGALLVLSLRRARTVVMDANNFTLRRGKKQAVIPWSAFADAKSRLKLEDVLAWQRLNVKAVSGGIKTSFSLDRIFGAGLPVPEITEGMRARIKDVCGRDINLT